MALSILLWHSAIITVFGLVGLLAIHVITSPQDAQAKGCNNTIAFNVSQGRCFRQ